MRIRLSGRLSVAQSLAAAGTVGSLAAVTILPALQGPVVFSSSVALNWMGLVALVWATAFGADNLAELRRTRVAEFEPLLDVVVEQKWNQGRSQLWTTVRNLGKGAAAGVRVRAWWPDADVVSWFPHEVQLPELIAPGEQQSADVEYPWTRHILEGEAPVHVGVELEYRDALGREHRRRLSFRVVKEEGVQSMRRVDADFPRNQHEKDALVRSRFAELTETLGLPALGLALVGEVKYGRMSAELRRDEFPLHVWSWDRDMSVSLAVGEVAEFIETERAATDELNSEGER